MVKARDGSLSLEDVDAGVHSVVIERRGYATAFRTMDNTLGNKGIVKASLSKVGSVTIKTKIADANVYIEIISSAQENESRLVR